MPITALPATNEPDARPHPRPAPPYATLSEASSYSRLSVPTLRRAIAGGRLKAHKAAGRVLLEYSALDNFVTGQQPREATSDPDQAPRECHR